MLPCLMVCHLEAPDSKGGLGLSTLQLSCSGRPKYSLKSVWLLSCTVCMQACSPTLSSCRPGRRHSLTLQHPSLW
jgi:hypothetical protein